jgi:hypothetical protein
LLPAAAGAILVRMTASNEKADLHRYLQTAREALLWKLEGVLEYDVRRPMVPTGTNLLGLVKHVASIEAGYFGGTFGRPFEEPLPWYDEGAEPNADMWGDCRGVSSTGPLGCGRTTTTWRPATSLVGELPESGDEGSTT